MIAYKTPDVQPPEIGGSTKPTFHPPIILQKTETEFQSAIRDEFINKSGISPAMFDTIAEFASDQDIQNGEVIGNPIAEFLNWEIKTSQSGFGPIKENSFALLLRNEDGTPWQAKLNQQIWENLKSRYGKPYMAPKRSEGELSPAYLPPIGPATRQAIGVFQGVEFPSEGSFWDFVEAQNEIDIVLGEGGKKSLCSLSYGVVTIALYGCDAGSKKIDGQHVLIPDLARFCQPGRTFVLAFDKDQTPETIERVRAAESRLAWLLRKQAKGITVKVATWEASQGKGLDDLVVNCGPEALHEAILESTVPPREELWMCLDSHNHQLGTWVQPKDEDKEPYFSPQTNFDLKVSKILEDSTGGGIEFEVTWMERSIVRTRRALVKTHETLTVTDFVKALTRGLKTHLTAKLKVGDLANIIQNRKTQYSRSGGVVYRLADRVGQQDDGTWVFENAQFKADGTLTTEQESRWMFNESLGELEKVPSPVIAPQKPEALATLAKAVPGFFHVETVPLVWFMCGYSVATMQRQAVMRQDHAFPQVNLFGDAGGGKTTAAKVGASLVGMHGDRSIITRFSESLIYEQVKSLGGVALILDDPVKKGMKQESRDAVDNFLWSMYNGVSRRVRGNEQTPNTNVVVTSNVALGEGNQAIESRLLKLHFPVRPVNEAGFPALEKAMGEATGGLFQLLAIQYDREAVREIRSRLLEHLTGSHSRISLSMALMVYFTQKFCDVAGVSFDAFEYAVMHLCPTANDFDSNKDSLTDFLEKLAIMRSEGQVGEWNLTQDKAGDLAIHLPSIWGGFQSRFNPNYSQQSLEQLIEGRGGSKSKVRRFVGTKQECADFKKALNLWEMGTGGNVAPLEPKKTENRKSVIVPRVIAEAAGFSNQDVIEPEQPTAAPMAAPIAEPEPTITAKAPTPEPIATPPQNGIPLGTWEHDATSSPKPKRAPTHCTPDGREGIIDREYGGNFVVLKTVDGKTFPGILKSDLTPIGGGTHVAA